MSSKNSNESRDRLRGLTLQSQQFRKKTVLFFPPLYEKIEKEDGTYEYELVGYEEEPINIGFTQPTVRERNKMINVCRTKEGVLDEMEFILQSIINLTFDPDSGDRLFEKADYDALVNQPAGSMVDQLGEHAIEMLTLGAPDLGNDRKPTTSSKKTRTTKGSAS